MTASISSSASNSSMLEYARGIRYRAAAARPVSQLGRRWPAPHPVANVVLRQVRQEAAQRDRPDADHSEAQGLCHGGFTRAVASAARKAATVGNECRSVTKLASSEARKKNAVGDLAWVGDAAERVRARVVGACRLRVLLSGQEQIREWRVDDSRAYAVRANAPRSQLEGERACQLDERRFRCAVRCRVEARRYRVSRRDVHNRSSVAHHWNCSSTNPDTPVTLTRNASAQISSDVSATGGSVGSSTPASLESTSIVPNVRFAWASAPEIAT